MTHPPRLAAWLLAAALPTADGEAIAGDLHEEFADHVAPRLGPRLARWWFAWQVARSLAPLFLRSWQRASLLRASGAIVAAGLAATLPAASLLALRAFILQQVPLKTTPEFSAAFALAFGVTILATALIGVAACARLLQAGRHRP